jgi:hypothetical protein
VAGQSLPVAKLSQATKLNAALSAVAMHCPEAHHAPLPPSPPRNHALGLAFLNSLAFFSANRSHLQGAATATRLTSCQIPTPLLPLRSSRTRLAAVPCCLALLQLLPANGTPETGTTGGTTGPAWATQRPARPSHSVKARENDAMRC